MSETRRGLPSSAIVLTGMLAAGGAAATAARIPDALAWSWSDLAGWAELAVAIAVLEQFWIEVRHGGQRENFSLTDAPFAAALILARPSVLTLAIAAGAVAGQSARRVAPLKLAFNVGQFLVGMTAAEAVYHSLAGRPGIGGDAWVAAIAAMAVYFLLNVTIVALVISLVEREPFARVLLSSLDLSVLHWAGNVALGILAATVWKTQPEATLLLAIPLGVSYLAYRSWIRGLRDRARMDELTAAAAAIAAEGDVTRRIPAVGPNEPAAFLGETLNRMLDRIEAAFERERRFFSEASHELRTPITICRGYLEVLGPDAAQHEIAEAMDVLLDELDTMGRIVDDVTTLARSEDPQFLRHEQVNLDAFLGEVAAKAAPLVNGRLRLSKHGDSALLRVDPQRLTQALINLLQNAVVHGDSDAPIDLHVRLEENGWRFSVADHGPGLPPGEAENVFRPFHRAGATAPGTGLGLAIVRSIAEAHGGSAGVESRPGRGVTFWIEVPQ